jgi:hypothetical protein
MKMMGIAAVLALLLAGPAAAQQQPVQKYGDPDKEKSQADIATEKEAERQYQRSLGNIPAQKSADPWGAVRSDNAAPKAAPKTPPKPKAAKSDIKTETKPETTAKQ